MELICFIKTDIAEERISWTYKSSLVSHMILLQVISTDLTLPITPGLAPLLQYISFLAP
jgi:hypothetical protein